MPPSLLHPSLIHSSRSLGPLAPHCHSRPLGSPFFSHPLPPPLPLSLPLRLYDYCYWREHLIIVTELLCDSLFAFYRRFSRDEDRLRFFNGRPPPSKPYPLTDILYAPTYPEPPPSEFCLP